MAYAYRDKYDILHAVDDLKTAKQFAKARIAEYRGACIGGYPAILLEVISYSDGRIYIGGNEKNGVEVNKLPEVIANEVKKLVNDIAV